MQIRGHTVGRSTWVGAEQHLMQEIVAADGNVAQRVFQQRPEMGRKARVLYFTKKLRLQSAAECPTVDQERKEEPPAARIPLAVEKLALSLE